MRYWDTSALLPLVVREDTTESVSKLYAADPVVLTWWGTRVEAASALARLEREGNLVGRDLRKAGARLRALSTRWAEVQPSELLRELAERLLRTHALRSADALQLASASIASSQRPSTLQFVSLHDHLSEAAQREGFPLALS
ncbi:MAG: type II toxin-antitoxin system VapC family toxin [Gemmatimonadaceae bacterium]